MNKIKIGLLLLLSINFVIALGQNDYPYKKYSYNYIRYDKNKIDFYNDSSAYERLFNKFDSLILRGKGKVNIIHIGGSHIQAGVYSGRVRERLQTFFPGLNGGRGIVFPYRMSRTNNPNNYNITWKGKWGTCRNVQLRSVCDLGLLGISAQTLDPSSSLKVVLGKNYYKYDFNRIKIFNEIGPNYYKVGLDKFNGNYTVKEYPEKRFTEIILDEHIDTLFIKLNKTDTLQNKYVLYGISLENEDPGIVYNDVGINGASIPSFLRCNLFEQQMSVLEPDLVIISLGTNDTYTKKFDPNYYKRNYKSLNKIIKKASPETAILMTVPNDSYYRRRYPNKNTAEAEKVIIETAKESGCGVWNFYQIMGGFNSSHLWHKDLLMAYDRIHFTNSGYIIKGDLLFNAILKAYDNHIEKCKEK